MDELVDLMIQVSKTEAEKLKKDGIFEAVLRDAKKRYKPFIKAVIQDTDLSKAENAEKLFYEVGKELDLKADKVINTMKNIDKHIVFQNGKLNSISGQLLQMAPKFDDVFKNMNVIKSLECMNVALNALNLGATIVGFVIISQKINEVDKKLQAVEVKIDKLGNYHKNELSAEYHELAMRFNSITNKMKNKETIDFDSLEDLLIDMNKFLKDKAIKNIEDRAIDPDLLLSMVNTLLPSYTILLKLYLTEHYLAFERMPDNCSSFLGIYQDLKEEKFIESVHDYFFLDKELSGYDSLMAVTIEQVLVNDELIQIFDRISIVKAVGSKAEYEKLDSLLNTTVKEYALEMAKKNEKDTDIDLELIADAVNRTYSAVMN